MDPYDAQLRWWTTTKPMSGFAQIRTSSRLRNLRRALTIRALAASPHPTPQAAPGGFAGSAAPLPPRYHWYSNVAVSAGGGGRSTPADGCSRPPSPQF